MARRRHGTPAWSAWSNGAWSTVDAAGGGSATALTERGAALRQAIEDATDRLAVFPYEALGEEGCAELRALARPFSRAVVEAAGLGADRLDRPSAVRRPAPRR